MKEDKLAPKPLIKVYNWDLLSEKQKIEFSGTNNQLKIYKYTMP